MRWTRKSRSDCLRRRAVRSVALFVKAVNEIRVWMWGKSSAHECGYQPCRPLDMLVVNIPHLNVSALTHLLTTTKLVRGKDTHHPGVSVALSVRPSVFTTFPVSLHAYNKTNWMH